MTVEDGATADGATADGAWVPQPLPDDDALARQPDPEELARTLAPLVAAPAGPADAEPDGAVPAEVDAEPDGAVPAEVDAEPDGAVPAEVLLSSAAVTSDARHSWTAAFIGAVVIVFFVFAPLQVLAGGVLPWSLAYLVGGALAVSGGLATGRALTGRGSVPLGPLVAGVIGLAVIVGCAVVAVVASQGLS